MKKIVCASVIAAFTLTGCATQTYLLAPASSNQPSKDQMQIFFVSGIAQEQDINAAEVCGGADKVAKVQTQQSVINGLLAGLTNGLFTPRQIRVYCK